MKYTVDIDDVINELLEKHIGIYPALAERINDYHYLKGNCDGEHGYCFLDASELIHPVSILYQRYLRNNNSQIAETSVVRRLLNDPYLFQSPLFHLLFKSFVAAEGKFIMNYIPQNSNEERLTGHLVSELENELFILSNYFKDLSNELYGHPIPLNFYYADLSSNKQEKITGADLGIILYVKMPDQIEPHIRVASIQAKKMNNKYAQIDVEQLERLRNKYGENAYYMYYDMSGQHFSPLIQRAKRISIIRTEDKKKSYQRDIIEDNSIPLSLFLIFDMFNSNNTHNSDFRNLWEAKRYLTNIDNYEDSPSNFMIMAIGSIDNEDIHGLNDLFLQDFPKYE